MSKFWSTIFPIAVVVLGALATVGTLASGNRLQGVVFAALTLMVLGTFVLQQRRNAASANEPDLTGTERDQISAVKESAGRVTAVRELRRLRPKLSLSSATRLVDSIDAGEPNRTPFKSDDTPGPSV